MTPKLASYLVKLSTLFSYLISFDVLLIKPHLLIKPQLLCDVNPMNFQFSIHVCGLNYEFFSNATCTSEEANVRQTVVVM